jgi:hypothetical protein
VLSSLRGRNRWDSKVLGPMIRKLQSLKPATTADKARNLARELQATIIGPVCAGIPFVINPFRSWVDAIEIACDRLEKEASKVYKLASSVDVGIRLGYDLFTRVTWKVPSHHHLETLILDYIDGKYIPNRTKLRIESALQLTSPRDKRTLIELVKNNLSETKPAKLLLGRTTTLLQRELRRELLNKNIRQMSTGNAVTNLIHGEWYWLEEGDNKAVYVYDKERSSNEFKCFEHVKSGKEKKVSHFDSSVKFRAYIAVGEMIRYA